MVELDQLLGLIESHDTGAWSERLFALARALGFEQVLVGVVASRHARLEDAFLESNYAPEWRHHYDEAKLAYVDPTVVHSMSSNLPIVWRPETFGAAPGPRELYEEACGYGIRSGVTFPIHGPNGEFGVISFASDGRPNRQFAQSLGHFLPDLALIRDYVFESSLRFMRARQSGDEDKPHLTPRELEVLNWVMVGKSSWEISRITRCAEATVNFHMANIRQKFKVNTRQQALVRAISLGIISPEDHHR